jgi:hypothetical protein
MSFKKGIILIQGLGGNCFALLSDNKQCHYKKCSDA